ncbi:MAG: type I secretion system permease/ATPase [Hyphomicrobiales bacterium]|nr:type I secretion system permease/ATPase [Hyphomicrobiales bacterium]
MNKPFLDTAAAEPDPLLNCLIAVATYHDRAVSADALTAGLPLAEGRLTPGLFERAAQRAGYAARLVSRSLNRLNPIVLPAILLLEDNDACVLLRKLSKRTFEIYDPLTDTRATTTLQELEDAYTGQAILIKPEIKLGTRGPETSANVTGHWFWGVVRRLWPSYLQVIIAAALINVLALASPLFIMNVYDRVLPNKAISTLWVLAAGMGLAVLFDLMLRSLRGWLIDAAGRRADVLLAGRIFEHVLGIKLSQRPSTTGSFANQLREFESVRDFFTSGTLATLTDVSFFGLFLFVIYKIGGPIAIIPAVAAFFVLMVGLVLQFPLRKAAQKTQAESAYRHSLLVEAIGALETIKTIRAEGVLQRTWERLVGRTAKTLEKARRISSLIMNITVATQQLVTVGIVIAGAYLFDAGEISMGAIIACVILGGRSVAPFGQFSSLIARSQQSFAALKTLNGLMKMDSERPDGKNFVSQPILEGRVEFQNIEFSYPEAPNPALNEFNLKIRPGEKVGIIGKIGSGKTTIGRLLGGLYEAQGGTILVDGIDIRQYHPYQLRRSVGIVAQDSDLFFGTLRSNILMGVPNATDDQMIKACQLAGVDDFANRHPSGFDMPVGERGSLLSGGQKQAVALARILLLRPQVIFLDEPSGSMDLASERLLIKHLREAFQNDQTIILSTHRYSMLELVDRLVVIGNGKVVADGPKDKVLEALKAKSSKAKTITA